MPTFSTQDGLKITASSQDSATGIDNFSDALLAFSDQSTGILATADNDPDCPLAQAYSAMFYASADTESGFKTARSYLARAQKVSGSATPREQAIVAAAAHWCERKLPNAAAIFEQVTDDNPSDILSAKWGQGLHFECGNAPGILRAPLKVAKHCDDNAQLHAMLAFGYEECHLLDKAEQSVHRSLKIDRTVAWAHHAMAHICEGRNTLERGLEFLDEHSDTWTGLMSFLSTHNWWHKCLFLLDLNRGEEALDVFDKLIWGIDKNNAQDQINAISILYRLERTGINVGQKRWDNVASYVKKNADCQASVFLDLQFLYALARTDMPAADAMVERIKAKAATMDAPGEIAWNVVAVRTAPAIRALANRDYGIAADLFSQTRSSMSAIGGSHAQRDMMTLFYIDALRGAGRWEKVQQLLVNRQRSRPKTSWINEQLREAYSNLGLAEVVSF